MYCLLNGISGHQAPILVSAVNLSLVEMTTSIYQPGVMANAASLPVSILKTPKAVCVKRDSSCLPTSTQVDVSLMPTCLFESCTVGLISIRIVQYICLLVALNFCKFCGEG